MGPTRALLLTDLLDIGGAETQLVALERAFDPTEVRAELVVLREDGGLLSQLSSPPRLWPRRVPFDPIPALKLRRLVDGRAIEVILTTHVWSLLYASALRVVMGSRAPALVATVHSYRRPAASARLEPLWRLALRSAERVIAVSSAQAEWLIEEHRLARDRVRVLPNAIEPERFTTRRSTLRDESTAPGERILLCVARLVSEKDHATLLEAFRIVARQHQDLTLVLVGDGPLRQELERRAEEIERELSPRGGPAGAMKRVQFIGAVSVTREWLARAEVFVLASRHESQGIVLLEAMASGLPVVATRVGGIPEMVIDGDTGLLVPPESPAALASAIVRLLEDRTLAAAMGRAGRARVEQHFSIRARAASLAGIFRELARSDRVE